MRLCSGSKRAFITGAVIITLGAGLHALAQQSRAPQPPVGGPKATFVGSDACKSCHKNIADAWATNAHAKALAAEGLTDSLKGCEACHGPGSAHIADPGAVKPISFSMGGRPSMGGDLKSPPIENICGKCHFEGEPNAVKDKTIPPKYWRRSEHNRGAISCTACHSAHIQSSKLLKKQAPDLCAGCHQNITKKGDYLHTPVAAGGCLTCHDPHGTSARHQLVVDVSKACAKCHDPKAPKSATAHHNYDVSSSDCTDCHSAHSRDRKGKLLRAKRHMPFENGQCQTCHKSGSLELAKPEKELCTMCHSKELAQAPSDGSHVHTPVGEGMCTRCHAAHASDAPKALWRDEKIAYACFVCHSAVEGTITGSGFAHKPAVDLNCTGCHTPHSSKQKKLLVKDSIELCKGCHEQHAHPLGKMPDGKTITDPQTKDVLSCASCHQPHGSDFDKLTKKDRNAALCLMCHDLDKETRK